MRQGAERQREERRESRADQGKSDGDSAVLDRGSRNSQALDVGRYRIARDQGYRLPSLHSVQVQVAGGQGRTGQGWLGTYCLAAADRGTLIYVCMHAIMSTAYSRKSCESRECLLDTTYQPSSAQVVSSPPLAACIRDWAARIRGTVRWAPCRLIRLQCAASAQGFTKERLDDAGRGLEATTRVAKPTE